MSDFYIEPSPVRLINDVSPVKGANNPAINCGPNAQKAQVVAPVNPGSQMSFFWHSGDDSKPNWPHNTGPVITYMAECTGTTCDKFDAANAQWFKIHEVGQHPNGTWFQEALCKFIFKAIRILVSNHSCYSRRQKHHSPRS